MNKTLQIMSLLVVLGILLSCSVNEPPLQEGHESAALSIQVGNSSESPLLKEIEKDTVFPPDLRGQ